MSIPKSIPYFRTITLISGLYGIAWLAFEGHLWRDLAWAAALLALGLAFLLVRYFGGRKMPFPTFVMLWAGLGLAYGVGLVFLTLFLMSLKTGLHAHGPEYSAQEVTWIWNQLPVWGGVGLLAGLGLGFLVVAWQRE